MQSRLRLLTLALVAVAVVMASDRTPAEFALGTAHAAETPTFQPIKTTPVAIKADMRPTFAPIAPGGGHFDRGRWCQYKKVEVYDEYHDETYYIDQHVCLRGFLK